MQLGGAVEPCRSRATCGCGGTVADVPPQSDHTPAGECMFPAHLLDSRLPPPASYFGAPIIRAFACLLFDGSLPLPFEQLMLKCVSKRE